MRESAGLRRHRRSSGRRRLVRRVRPMHLRRSLQSSAREWLLLPCVKPSGTSVRGGRRDGLLETGEMPCADRLDLPSSLPFPLPLPLPPPHVLHSQQSLPPRRLHSFARSKPQFRRSKFLMAVSTDAVRACDSSMAFLTMAVADNRSGRCANLQGAALFAALLEQIVTGADLQMAGGARQLPHWVDQLTPTALRARCCCRYQAGVLG